MSTKTLKKPNRPTAKKAPLSGKDLDELLLGAQEAMEIIREKIPELTRILYYARKKITNQKGQRRNPKADDYISLTWSGYCRDIGLSQPAANKLADYFMNGFVPSNAGGKRKAK
jgi:hypothetical protein